MNINVRCVHLDHSEHVDRYARERLAQALGNFNKRIERIDVLLEDTHGAKHGIERRCVIRVVIAGVSDAVVQHVHPDVYQGIDAAAHRIKRVVRRRINRRRDIAHHRAHEQRFAA